MCATQSALQAARQERLNQERTWRFLIAIYFVIIPAVILFLKRGKTVGWLLAGALIYHLLFNVRFAVLDGLTYSLSWAKGMEQVVFYYLTTTAIALIIAWVTVMLVLKAFSRGPRQAAGTALGLVLTSLYLLSLPILWSYTLNGTQVGWTLPDFPSMFLGFLSLIQALFLAGLGITLTGISALIGWAAGKIKKR